MNEFGVKVDLTEKARNWLAKTGYDEAFGARPLRRALQKFVESPLSVKLLSGEYKKGDLIEVDVEEKEDTEKDKQLVFRKANLVVESHESKPRKLKTEKADNEKKDAEVLNN